MKELKAKPGDDWKDLLSEALEMFKADSRVPVTIHANEIRVIIFKDEGRPN